MSLTGAEFLSKVSSKGTNCELHVQSFLKISLLWSRIWRANKTSNILKQNFVCQKSPNICDELIIFHEF